MWWRRLNYKIRSRAPAARMKRPMLVRAKVGREVPTTGSWGFSAIRGVGVLVGALVDPPGVVGVGVEEGPPVGGGEQSSR